MKKLALTLLLASIALSVHSQQSLVDRLKISLSSTTNDTLRLVIQDSICVAYREIDPDSSLHYGAAGLVLSRQLGYKLSEALCMNNIGYALLNLGDYPRALQAFFDGIMIADNEANEESVLPLEYRATTGIAESIASTSMYRLQVLGWLHFNLGLLYENANDSQNELKHYRIALRLANETGNKQVAFGAYLNLGRAYLTSNRPDSALACEEKAYEICLQLGFQNYLGSVLLNLGRAHVASGNTEEGVKFIRESIAASRMHEYIRGVIAGNLLLAQICIDNNELDSAYYFATAGLWEAQSLHLPDLLLRSYSIMTEYYKLTNNSDSIVKYQGLTLSMKDSLFNSRQARQFQDVDFREQQRQQEIELAKEDYRDRIQKYALLFGLSVVLVTSVVLWRNNRHKEKAYVLLRKQKQETDAQKVKVENALQELKSTQAQLIQKEKMASLGELTAGIAHEIQNPLNFVNNFSEVSNELLEEMKADLATGNVKPATETAENIKQNLEKIIHHGKRADAIVKNMLQHSRGSSGQKQSIDINTLCEDYLKLAFHGFRAKEKSFNVKYETSYDRTIEKLSVVPQEIGRVVLNLINNAVYAVLEKRMESLDGYEPMIWVSTKKKLGLVEIKVTDNGSGVPDEVKEKIFQPFFTTKPAGEGAGLGLSLSYDIIKAHGGMLKVESKENAGSTFIIEVPFIDHK